MKLTCGCLFYKLHSKSFYQPRQGHHWGRIAINVPTVGRIKEVFYISYPWWQSSVHVQHSPKLFLTHKVSVLSVLYLLPDGRGKNRECPGWVSLAPIVITFHCSRFVQCPGLVVWPLWLGQLLSSWGGRPACFGLSGGRVAVELFSLGWICSLSMTNPQWREHQELNGVHPFYHLPLDGQWAVCVPPNPLEVHNNLLVLVVFKTRLSVHHSDGLFAVWDESQHGGLQILF